MAKGILVVTGPTATGKTGLGVRLAKALDGEVISADSMQIYRGMDIGTAKATAEEMRGVPHHMIDVADPAESWSVARWAAFNTASASFQPPKSCSAILSGLIYRLLAPHSLARSSSVVVVLPEPLGPATTHKVGLCAAIALRFA